MKKVYALVVLVSVFFVSYLFAEVITGDIGPAISETATVVIPMPGPGRRNCISDLIMASTASTTGVTTFRMLTSQTTTFMVVITTTTPPVVDPFTESWCADYNSSATIKSDGRAYQIYYKGYIGAIN